MSLRIRRTIKLAPGIKLNLGKRGISTTFGPRGLSVNVSKRGSYLNAGLPGTGISSRTKIGESEHQVVAPIEHEVPPAAANVPAEKPTIRHSTILIFFGTLLIVGVLKNDSLFNAYWAAWFVYWLFLGVRRIVRNWKA